MCMVLLVLEVVLVVLEVTGPQVPWGKFQIRLSLRPDLYSPAPPIKLQTARISTVLMLQGRDQDRALRINLLYTAMGGLGGVKKRV